MSSNRGNPLDLRAWLREARELLAANPNPTEDEIRHYLSGNLCRCAAYPEIIEAVKLAARRRKSARKRLSEEGS